ncbi:MAG: carboxymuconolactone decarboxylase family protein, partial [Methanobacteriota archaeon]
MARKREEGKPLKLSRNIKAFWEERERLNEIVLKNAGLTTKRFFSLDHQAYQEGALPVKTKEMLGLVASLVLRCDDCINYHLVRCFEEGVSTSEVEEVMSIG